MAATIVMLPSAMAAPRQAVIDALRARGGGVIDIDVDMEGADLAPLSVRVCAAILIEQPQPPLVIVALADAASLLPAVSLAQRTAHRSISGYVLIDPQTDPTAPEWPDAPVLVIGSEDGSTGLGRARLRGWSMATAQQPEQIVSALLDFSRVD